MQVTFTTGHLEITRRNFSRLPRVGERVVLSTSEDGDTTAFRVLDVEWDMTGEEPTAMVVLDPETVPAVVLVLQAADKWVHILERSYPLIACKEASALVEAVKLWRRVHDFYAMKGLTGDAKPDDNPSP
jgi:hypothetical protein